MSHTIGQNEEGEWCVYDTLGARIFICGTYPDDAADICHYLNGGSTNNPDYIHELMNNHSWRDDRHV